MPAILFPGAAPALRLEAHDIVQRALLLEPLAQPPALVVLPTCHLGEGAVEIAARLTRRHVAGGREGGPRGQSRRLDRRLLALGEGRRGRERDEVRNVAGHPMGQVDRVLAACYADVDVLAEHGELLGEVAVERGDALEALRREDAPLGPAVERM